MTNYERIKAMSVEEMANLFEEISDACCDAAGGWHCWRCPIGSACNCEACNLADIRKWLESECDT